MHAEVDRSAPWWAVVPNRATTIGDHGRVVAGVASEMSSRLAVEPLLVRLAFVVLAVAGGWGILVYTVAWAALTFVSQPPAEDVPPRARPSRERDLGFGIVVFGLVLEARVIGVGFNDAVVWPLLLVAIGIGVVGRRLREVGVGSAVGDDGASAWSRTARVVGGVALILGGALAFGGSDVTFSVWLRMIIALVIVLVGVYLLLGPSLRAMGDALLAERRQRIRADERAVISSHLHDSVLQTLALIQRRADDSTEVAALARHQERELRAWLYDGAPANEGTLHGAFAAAAAEIEDLHRVVIETVVVGDGELDERSAAMVAAAREALVNASKFSGEQRISFFVEVDEDVVEAFVRDRGKGFEPSEVPPDRRGIADSICGRMERAGGTAHVRSAPGEGTEVHLVLPRELARR
jgi:signal transduction histidine kinase/phage shock protein PspC (stress-responsive transcriptional regulator)